MLFGFIRRNTVSIVAVAIIVFVIFISAYKSQLNRKHAEELEYQTNLIKIRSMIDSGSLKEAQAFAESLNAGLPEVKQLLQELKEKSRRKSLSLAKTAFDNNNESQAIQHIEPYLANNDADAHKLLKEFKERKEEEALPPPLFPEPIKGSLSEVSKFPAGQYGRFLTFDLSGLSVDDIQSDKYGYYLQGVKDLSTNEYVSSYKFRFHLTESMAKIVFPILPKSGRGLIHLSISCVPQKFEIDNKPWCVALNFRTFNAGGQITNSFVSELEDNFNKGTKAKKRDILKKHFGENIPINRG